MPNVSKQGREIERGSSLSAIYRKIVKPGCSVVVVGPSSSVFDDATGLLTASLLGQGRRFNIADPVSDDRIFYQDLRTRLGGMVAGIGNVNRYMREMSQAKKYGMPLAEPDWLGTDSGAQKIPVPDQSVDVIIDHDVSPFLSEAVRQSDGDEKILKSCYREYSRVLKRGGQIILQTNVRRYQQEKHGELSHRGIIGSTLRSYGFEVDKRKVEDIVTIPVSDEVVTRLNIVRAEDEDIGYFLRTRVVGESGRYYLRFDRPSHYSGDVFLATKK